MSLRYLFPCENCDHVFELVAKQAGQDLKCPKCEAASSAPKLGTLRQLETIGGAESKPSGAANGATRNSLFVIGLAMAIIGGAAGAGLYQYATSMIREFDIHKVIDNFDAWIDEQAPSDVVALYETMELDKGLGDWEEQPHVGSNRQGRILRNFSYGLMGISGIGLLLLVGSFLFGPRGGSKLSSRPSS